MRRAGAEESRHAVDIALVDSDGAVLLGLGDIERPIFARSAMKPLQAIALAEKLNDSPAHQQLCAAEMSLICASHNGQIYHSETVQKLLGKFDLSPDLLACAPHWSLDEVTLIEQARRIDRPACIHNNCSGKHAGMLVLGKLMDVPLAGYADISHPVQQTILGVLEVMTGTDLMQFTHGIDGCGAPAPSAPLGNWARGFAMFADAEALSAKRAAACADLRESIAGEPMMIAGDRRLCSALARAFGSKITAKVGAEGVYGAAFNELGLGVMMKVRDGNRRAVEIAIGAVIHLLGYDIPADLVPYFAPTVKNWASDEVGDFIVEGAIVGVNGDIVTTPNMDGQ